MTSAPCSARSSTPSGPAEPQERSRMRMPSRACATWGTLPQGANSVNDARDEAVPDWRPAVTSDDRYFQPELETMPRADLDRLQEDKLLSLLPYAYERSAIVRETWEAAGVHPRDIRSMADFVERVPFIDKDAIRSFRDRHKDPYGGLLCVPERELIAIYSTSGTTGDPTPTPQGEPHGSALGREFWELGVRPGDHMVMFLFTFRGVTVFRSIQDVGAVPLFFDHTPAELPRLAEASRHHRPTGLYLVSGPLIMAIDAMAPAMGIDPKELFAPYRGVVLDRKSTRLNSSHSSISY